MNRQEIYERQRVHFTRPGAAFGVAQQGCVYVGEVNGKVVKCAVGCLIPDDVLAAMTLRLFGGIDALLSNNPELVGEMGWGDNAVNFLRKTQRLHDDTAQAEGDLELFIHRLDCLARREGLDVRRAEALCTPACPED